LSLQDGSVNGRDAGVGRVWQNANRRNHFATAIWCAWKRTFLRARRRVVPRSRALLTNQVANATSRVRLGTWSLRKTACRCFFTIGKLNRASSATSWLLRPWQTSCATFCSRLVSPTRAGKYEFAVAYWAV